MENVKTMSCYSSNSIEVGRSTYVDRTKSVQKNIIPWQTEWKKTKGRPRKRWLKDLRSLGEDL